VVTLYTAASNATELHGIMGYHVAKLVRTPSGLTGPDGVSVRIGLCNQTAMASRNRHRLWSNGSRRLLAKQIPPVTTNADRFSLLP